MVWGEIFLLVAFFVGLALGDDGKVRALVAALGGGFWTWWFWLGVAGLGLMCQCCSNRGSIAVPAFLLCWRRVGPAWSAC
ncbi:hypothetical protein ECZU29_12950 [Escherichia coli]|nr:hypothetical protein ECZU29_12950 [Escherichia coli]